MLPDHPVYAALPTADPDRLLRFYEDVLGFAVRHENARTIYYGAGAGTVFALARSGRKPSGAHTQVAFMVEDVDADVAALRSRGVVFESTSRHGPSTASPTWRSGRRPGSWILTAT